MSDIVDRLRDWALALRLPLTNKHVGALNEAAAVIERLRAERDEARAACAGMMHSLEWIAESHDAGRHDGLSEPCPVHDADTMFAIACQTLANITIGADVLAVVEAAREYRKAEQDGTPRMWRGKDLQDLASALDSALEKLSNEQPRETGEHAATAGNENDCGRG